MKLRISAFSLNCKYLGEESNGGKISISMTGVIPFPQKESLLHPSFLLEAYKLFVLEIILFLLHLNTPTIIKLELVKMLNVFFQIVEALN